MVLRELTIADADRLFEIHANAEAMRWFGNDPMPSRQNAVDFIQRLAAGRSNAAAHIRWALCDNQSEEQPLYGTCGLFRWDANGRTCTLGYELHPEAQGQGLMTEALREVIAWAFEVREVNRITADIHPANEPSLGLAGRIGFVEEGLQRQAGYWGGRHHDLILCSLLRDDWMK